MIENYEVTDLIKRPKYTFGIFETIITIISILFISFSIWFILDWYMENKHTEKIMGELASTISENIISYENKSIKTIEYNLDKLLDINSDTVGWIYLNNTNVNYPVVQTKDNDYYLTHSFDRLPNKAGWIFADFRNNLNNLDTNTIIYGHNRKDGSMFKTLEYAIDDTWREKIENHYINFSTKTNNSLWEIFSVYKMCSKEYNFPTNFNSTEDFNSYINSIKNLSLYEFDVDLTSNDKILTLVTCTNLKTSGIIMHAKLVY